MKKRWRTDHAYSKVLSFCKDPLGKLALTIGDFDENVYSTLLEQIMFLELTC